MKKTLRKLAALLLPAILLLSMFQMPAMAKGPAVLRVAVLSDPHFYADEMTGGFCDAFQQANSGKGRPAELSETLFLATLKEIKARAKRDGLDYLLVPGDLTRDGEYEGHARVAQLLRQFEKETGVPVAVVPGNHDVNKGNAADYSSGQREQARNLPPGDFLNFYAKLGYDLPGCERMPDTLSYAADLGKNYRLIAIDDNLNNAGGAERPTQDELRDWVIGQCEKAMAAGKTIIGMAHHPLAEQLGGQEAIMHNLAFKTGNHEMGEAFADAGMHFYLTGHLHLSEIATLVSDSGEPLYDITTASAASFPGGYRTVKFSAQGKQVKAEARSHAAPPTAPSPFKGAYYETLFGRTYGADLVGGGLAGNIKARAREGVAGLLDDLKIPAAMQVPVFAAVNSLIDEAFALPVSQLPCDRFIKEYGFGNPKKPGTVEDLANSALVYMFGKNHDPSDDPFMQDALRRIGNGEFIDQALSFVVPALVTALSGGALAKLANHPLVAFAADGLLALVVSPAKRAALSESLCRAATGLVASQSPTKNRDGTLTYSGPIAVPTDPGTFRLPQDIGVRKGLACAEITWYTRQSAAAPELIVTDKDGNPAPEVKVSIGSKAEELTAEQLDIGFTKILGRAQPALKHTARLTGLKPGKGYRFTAGDSAWGWRGEPREFRG